MSRGQRPIHRSSPLGPQGRWARHGDETTTKGARVKAGGHQQSNRAVLPPTKRPSVIRMSIASTRPASLTHAVAWRPDLRGPAFFSEPNARPRFSWFPFSYIRGAQNHCFTAENKHPLAVDHTNEKQLAATHSSGCGPEPAERSRNGQRAACGAQLRCVGKTWCDSGRDRPSEFCRLPRSNLRLQQPLATLAMGCAVAS